MKVTTIGGGSTYTPELVHGFIERAEKLELRELWLMDISRERLDVVGSFAQRMVEEAHAPFRLVLSTDLQAALAGATFVTTQIRVGGMAARREDEYLGRRWNLVGQETTGIGGMAKALRTVPVILDIARRMTELCPDAWLVNFTNPSGLVTEALQRYAPQVRSVGLCNSPIGYQMRLAQGLGLESPFQVHLDYLGLNHLSWIRGASVAGRDVWPQMFEAALEAARSDDDPPIPADVMESLGVICNYYLHYYYRTPAVLAEQAEGGPSRAEEVMEIEKQLLARYSDSTLTTMPEELMQRGGAYYSTAAVQLIAALALDLGEEHIVNTRVGDAVPGYPADWVMELPCRVDGDGIHPLPAEPLPLFADGLLRAVKAYELLTAEAALTGDRDLALQALIVHPLGPDGDRALAVLEDILETHRAYLPNFVATQTLAGT
ncbi:6-phospho-beta-glucosidase [Candidatus Woesearchaeota archaeon]|nr:MAG: 6-phospho-beta-glucosidase [Candidatus Woesearchaeota archaeon]